MLTPSATAHLAIKSIVEGVSALEGLGPNDISPEDLARLCPAIEWLAALAILLQDTQGGVDGLESAVGTDATPDDEATQQAMNSLLRRLAPPPAVTP